MSQRGNSGQRFLAVGRGIVVAAGSMAVAATLATGIVMAPAPSPQARLVGVQNDLRRAVALRQLTSEQAAFFENQLRRKIDTGEGISGGSIDA